MSTPKSKRNKKMRDILPFLRMLKGMRPAQRGIMIPCLNEKTCQALYETISNVLRNEKIQPKQRQRLKKTLLPHKNTLRHLTHTKRSPRIKRKKLSQMGGSPITSILGAAISLILSALYPNK